MDISCCTFGCQNNTKTNPYDWVLADPSAESVSENKDCLSYFEH